MNKYKINDVVKCKVTSISPYGAFVKVDDEHDGMVHISEISDYYVAKIQDYINMDDELELVVLGYTENKDKVVGRNKDVKKLRLSYKLIRPELLKPKPETTSKSFQEVDSELE